VGVRPDQRYPSYAELPALMLAPLEAWRDEAIEVVDLGVGSGHVASRVLEHFPRARVTGIDLSATELADARARLAGFGDRVRLVEGDFRATPRLAAGADLVTAGLALHGISDAEKAVLFAGLGLTMASGGAVVVADLVRAPDPALGAVYRAAIGRHMSATMAPPEVAGELDRLDATALPATVDDQLAWLRAAGFRRTDCWWRSFGLAVFGGFRD
jgi:tRNA (cmo5U34)-methyltransferase